MYCHRPIQTPSQPQREGATEKAIVTKEAAKLKIVGDDENVDGEEEDEEMENAGDAEGINGGGAEEEEDATAVAEKQK